MSLPCPLPPFPAYSTFCVGTGFSSWLLFPLDWLDCSRPCSDFLSHAFFFFFLYSRFLMQLLFSPQLKQQAPPAGWGGLGVSPGFDPVLTVIAPDEGLGSKMVFWCWAACSRVGRGSLCPGQPAGYTSYSGSSCSSFHLSAT